MLNLLAFGQARRLDGIFRYVTSKWLVNVTTLYLFLRMSLKSWIEGGNADFTFHSEKHY